MQTRTNLDTTRYCNQTWKVDAFLLPKQIKINLGVHIQTPTADTRNWVSPAPVTSCDSQSGSHVEAQVGQSGRRTGDWPQPCRRRRTARGGRRSAQPSVAPVGAVASFCPAPLRRPELEPSAAPGCACRPVQSPRTPATV